MVEKRLQLGQSDSDTEPGELDQIIKALGVELRRQLLKCLASTQAPLSPSRAGSALLLPTQKTNYHFKVLAESGLIVFAFGRPVRGVRESFFVANPAAISDPIIRSVLDATSLWPRLEALNDAS